MFSSCPLIYSFLFEVLIIDERLEEEKNPSNWSSLNYVEFQLCSISLTIFKIRQSHDTLYFGTPDTHVFIQIFIIKCNVFSTEYFI